MSQPIQEPTIGLGEDIEAFGYKQELRRGLQLHDVVLYGVLFMVLIAPQSIWGSLQVDSGGLTPLVYIIGFVAISFTALSYAAMSSKFPIAGSVYSYVQRAINPHVGFMSGWLILLDYILVPSLLLVMVANWGTTLVPGSPWWLWVVVFIAFNTFVNVRGITMSKGVDWIIFAVEILALIVFIAVGCMYVSGGGGYGEFSTEPFYKPGEVDLHFVATAVSLACLSFLGFDGMSTLAEETYKPEKNIGKGILIALCIMIVVFVAQTYVAALILPDWANTDPDMGFFDACYAAGGLLLQNFMLVINIVAIGIANIMNAQIASSRLLFSMGRDGVLPRVLGKVHPKYQTPWVAAIFLGAFSLVHHSDRRSIRRHDGARPHGELRRAGVVHRPELRRVLVLLVQGEAARRQGRLALPHLPLDRYPYSDLRVHRLRCAHLWRGHQLVHRGPHHCRCHFQGLQRSARRLQEPGSVAAVPAGLTVPKGIHRSSSFARRSARHLSSPRPCRGLFLYTRFAPRNSHLFPIR